MKILIIHYHLQHGGVTRIIDSQLVALKKMMPLSNIMVLSGEHPAEGALTVDVPLKVLPALNYIDVSKPGRKELRRLLPEIEKFIRDNVTPETIIHAHNINLGKNPLLTYAVHKISIDGIPVLKHCHDFAEDGRPWNARFLKHVLENCLGLNVHEVMYPALPNVHFGVINSRDGKLLMENNIGESRIHLLPNPVHFGSEYSARPHSEIIAGMVKILGIDPLLPVFTYPVRAIRRKNIGEFILFAFLFAEKANWLITLPPHNPVEKTEYEKWKDFCAANHIKVIFEAGEKIDFADIMKVSTRCVTTSVKEGFGMVFLEPWYWGVPVVGRYIRGITGDFVDSGVALDDIYMSVNANGHTDFAGLSTDKQRNFILKLRQSKSAEEKFMENNPDLKNLFRAVSQDIIDSNKQAIKDIYSLEKYGKKLIGVYRELSGES